jgi:hypothetical protein
VALKRKPYQLSVMAEEQARLCIRAADMAARGETFTSIARELSLASPAEAKKCVEKAYSIAPGEDYRMGRRKAADELDALRREFWKIVDDPGPATTVTGKLVTVEDPVTGEEKTLEDKQAKIAALNGLRAVNAEYRKLFGSDAPRQTVTISAASSLDEIHAHIAKVRAEIEEAEGPPALPPGEDPEGES